MWLCRQGVENKKNLDRLSCSFLDMVVAWCGAVLVGNGLGLTQAWFVPLDDCNFFLVNRRYL